MKMTFAQAIEHFGETTLNDSFRSTQSKAFAECCEFLKRIGKTKIQNTRRTSYALKHIVENPTDLSGVESTDDAYWGYIHEGTLILAAFSEGFTTTDTRKPFTAITFNMSEFDLKQRMKDVAASRLKALMLA